MVVFVFIFYHHYVLVVTDCDGDMTDYPTSFPTTMPTDNHWYCLTGYSCTNETIVQGSGDNFYAYGYKSVAGVKTSIASQEARLYGAYAAQHAQLVNMTYKGECFGYKSCDNVKELIIDDATLQCDGSASCTNIGSINVVSGDSYTRNASCYGDFSCANSVFKDTQETWGYGAYSLYNTYFDFSESTRDVSIWYVGSYSGVNSTIICNNGGINCQINCYSNACGGVKLWCNPQIGNCSEFTIRCWSCDEEKLPSSYSYYMNSGTMVPFDIKNNSNSKDKYGILQYFGSSENRNEKCDGQSSYVYDDYNMSLNENERENQYNDSVICLRGYYTGRSNAISTLGDESDIVCSGHESCYGTSMSVNGYGSNIFCLGNNACSDIVPLALYVNAGIDDASYSYTDSSGRVWVSDVNYENGGLVSSTSGAISVSGDYDEVIYQTERFMLSDSLAYTFSLINGVYNITLHFAEIYFTSSGQRIFDIVIQGTTLSENFDIYDTVGHDTAITFTYDHIVVEDGILTIQLSESVENPKISGIEIIPVDIASSLINGRNNNNNTLYCGGKNSCQATRITNFEHLYVTGAFACAYCDIYGVRNVYLVTYQAGLSSMISSNGNGYMNVYLDGYGSGQSVYLECILGDVCNIYCLTNDACDNSTEVDCRFGTECNIHCDETMGCPIVYNTTDAPTFLPTTLPTALPTTSPTEYGVSSRARTINCPLFCVCQIYYLTVVGCLFVCLFYFNRT